MGQWTATQSVPKAVQLRNLLDEITTPLFISSIFLDFLCLSESTRIPTDIRPIEIMLITPHTTVMTGGEGECYGTEKTQIE